MRCLTISSSPFSLLFSASRSATDESLASRARPHLFHGSFPGLQCTSLPQGPASVSKLTYTLMSLPSAPSTGAALPRFESWRFARVSESEGDPRHNYSRPFFAPGRPSTAFALCKCNPFRTKSRNGGAENAKRRTARRGLVSGYARSGPARLPKPHSSQSRPRPQKPRCRRCL